MKDEFGFGKAIPRDDDKRRAFKFCLGCILIPPALGFLVVMLGMVVSLVIPGPARSVRLTRTEIGERWPLTVDGGKLWRDGQAIVFTPDSGEANYAVNGPAEQQGYRRIDPIWAPGDHGMRKDISPLIERGNALQP